MALLEPRESAFLPQPTEQRKSLPIPPLTWDGYITSVVTERRGSTGGPRASREGLSSLVHDRCLGSSWWVSASRQATEALRRVGGCSEGVALTACQPLSEVTQRLAGPVHRPPCLRSALRPPSRRADRQRRPQVDVGGGLSGRGSGRLPASSRPSVDPSTPATWSDTSGRTFASSVR
jgi:hypothetical protein